ncbi:MAG: hypothetical protein M3433_02125 [Actinomycetota bacterium]|nr:hypothetical protein [Actinomycetota bacterium]
MKIALITARRRLHLQARASALFGLILVAFALPVGAGAEQASQPPEPAAAQLDAGRNHSCAVLAGAGVRCWGFGVDGQLGYGNTATIGDDETPGAAGPVDLGSGRTAASISAGSFHTCAGLDDGNVRCWGFGANGRLGHQSPSNVGDDETPASVPPVDLGSGRTALAVSAGGAHSCALLNGGDVRCWGYGEYGALGYGGEVNDPAQPATPDIGDDEAPGSVGPVDFGSDRTAVAITAGGRHTCALLDDGTVRCFGWAFNGQLGYGNVDNASDPSTVGPVKLGDGRTAVAISAGLIHTCALLDDGNVRCWGARFEGRLGLGNEISIGDDETPDTVAPVNLGGRRAVAISAGDRHTCALLEGGDVRCWGAAFAGQLGYGDTTNIGDDETPASAGPVDLGLGRTARALSAGGQHTCVRLDDAGLSCWGFGGNGRLGYCNTRNVGDDEPPGAVGPVPVEVGVTAPSTAYPGCARPALGGLPDPAPAPGGGARRAPPVSAPAAEAARRRGLRGCFARVSRHAGRETRRAQRGSRSERARLKRHVKRHRSRQRRTCLRRHGRTPGRVVRLKARAVSRTKIALTFRAAGSDGNRPPAARSYLVKQSSRPIRSRRGFRRAQTLCEGRCRFPSVRAVGGTITLTVVDLRPRTTYHYAVAARDNVSKRPGPRSRAASARTR